MLWPFEEEESVPRAAASYVPWIVIAPIVWLGCGSPTKKNEQPSPEPNDARAMAEKERPRYEAFANEACACSDDPCRKEVGTRFKTYLDGLNREYEARVRDRGEPELTPTPSNEELAGWNALVERLQRCLGDAGLPLQPGAKCPDALNAVASFTLSNAACTSDADCIDVALECGEPKATCHFGYINTRADMTKLTPLAETVERECAPRGCFYCNAAPRAPACLDGRCAAGN